MSDCNLCSSACLQAIVNSQNGSSSSATARSLQQSQARRLLTQMSREEIISSNETARQGASSKRPQQQHSSHCATNAWLNSEGGSEYLLTQQLSVYGSHLPHRMLCADINSHLSSTFSDSPSASASPSPPSLSAQSSSWNSVVTASCGLPSSHFVCMLRFDWSQIDRILSLVGFRYLCVGGI